MGQIAQNDDRLYSVRDAAEYLGGVSQYSVHAWMSQKRLVRTKVAARTMIRKSELDRFVREGGKAPTAKGCQ